MLKNNILLYLLIVFVWFFDALLAPAAQPSDAKLINAKHDYSLFISPIAASNNILPPSLFRLNALCTETPQRMYTESFIDGTSNIFTCNNIEDFLNDKEVESILSHELTHILNKDSFYLIFWWSLAFSIFIFFYYRLLHMALEFTIDTFRKKSYTQKADDKIMLGIFWILILILPTNYSRIDLIIEEAVRAFIQPQYELNADIGAKHLTSLENIKSALIKVYEIEQPRRNANESALKGTYLGDFLPSHPSLENRLKNLTKSLNHK